MGREMEPGASRGGRAAEMIGAVRTRAVTVGVAIAAIALIAAAVVLNALSGAHATSWAETVVGSVGLLMTCAVAVLIGVRRPGHLIGLLLAASALLVSLSGAAEAYGIYAVLAHPGSLPAGRLAVLWTDASWPTLFVGVAAIAFVFPDGQLPSPRWRRVAICAGVSFAGTIAVGLVTPDGFDAPFEHVSSPLPDLSGALGPLQALLLAGTLAGLIASALAVRARYRRADGVERQQILWLACAAWLIPVTVIVCLAGILFADDPDAIIFGFVLATVTAVPAAIGVAVLRFRLYDLDRVVNRALVYGALTVGVVALYAAVVVALGSLVQSSDSFLISLLGTGVVAVAVQPARTWLQRRVDRLMYGDRDDPYAGLSRLATRLQASVAPDAALSTIVTAVADVLRVPFVAIDLARDAASARAATHGRPGRGEHVTVALAFQGERVGDLVVEERAPGEPFGAADRRLLNDLAGHAGAAVHAIRLTADLQRSRERLVLAREEERRRIRRDLHDGLGPALAGAVFQSDAARDLIVRDPEAADALLVSLREGLQAAVADIRALVYALRPPALDELGLVPALHEQAARLNAIGTGPRISIEGPAELPDLPAAVEVAAYRIAVEAITNAVRHSGASTCSVHLYVNGGLEIDVVDDSATSRQPYRPGVGIASMRERASELGAILTVLPGRHGGTHVHTVLPLARE
jgi:two-component system NarL family sensor kinase